MQPSGFGSGAYSVPATPRLRQAPCAECLAVSYVRHWINLETFTIYWRPKAAIKNACRVLLSPILADISINTAKRSTGQHVP